MSKFRCCTLAAIVGLGLSYTPLVWAAQGVLHSATGSGGIRSLYDGEYRSFAFTAVQHSEDGKATGELQLKNRASDIVYHVRIEYMFINDQDPTVAGFAGTIVKCDADPVRVGNWTACSVKDNGEGKNASPDMIAPMYWYWADAEEFPYSTQVLAWLWANIFNGPGYWVPAENGNVQVR